MSVSAMPAVTTTAAMETTATETTVETTAREIAVEASTSETPVETPMMKVMMTKEPKADPNPYGNAVGVVRK